MAAMTQSLLATFNYNRLGDLWHQTCMVYECTWYLQGLCFGLSVL